MTQMLEFTKKALTPTMVKEYQAGDGTIYYHEFTSSPERLYVKHQSKEIAVILSDKSTFIPDPLGNSMMCFSDDKVYKLQFIAPDIIDATSSRSFGVVTSAGFDTFSEGNDKFVFRVHEHPRENPILVDLPMWTRIGSSIMGLHRNRIINTVNGARVSVPSVSTLTANSIVVKLPSNSVHMIARESSRFIYFFKEGRSVENNGILYTLDTEKNEFLPTLKFSQNYYKIVGIHNRTVTITHFERPNKYFSTAQLPDGYFESEPNAQASIAMSHSGDNPETVSGLLNKIAELTQEMNRVQIQNEELSAALAMNKGTTENSVLELLSKGWVLRRSINAESHIHGISETATGSQKHKKFQQGRTSNDTKTENKPSQRIFTKKEEEDLIDHCDTAAFEYSTKNTLNEARDILFNTIESDTFSQPSVQMVFKCFMRANVELSARMEKYYGHVIASCLLKKSEQNDVKGREEILQGITDCCREIVLQKQWIERPQIWETIAEVLVHIHPALSNLFDGARPTLSDFKYAFFAAAQDTRKPYTLFVFVLKSLAEKQYQWDRHTYMDAAAQVLRKCESITEHMDTEMLDMALRETETTFGKNLYEIYITGE